MSISKSVRLFEHELATLGRSTHAIKWLESLLLSARLQEHEVVVASTGLREGKRVVDEIVESALKRSID